MTDSRRPDPTIVERSRALRREATVPERLLWGVVRGGRLAGLKFRRQEPVSPFIVDFCCHAARLVVELDGRSHEGRAAADRARSEFLEREGFRVVRFSNDDVIGDLDAVANTIVQLAHARIEELAAGRSNNTRE